MLEVSGVAKSFVDGEQTVTVLEDLEFQLDDGNSLAVTGPSGSGKSTLLNILAGVLLPDQGELKLCNRTLDVTINHLQKKARTQLRRQSIGYVHQFFNLIPTLTVLENVLLPAELNRMDEARQRALDLLERVDLVPQADAFPETLSGGQQQRVAVARALIIEPELVLADEPTGNLDRANADRVSDLLFETSKEQGAMLVVATHSETVAGRADRLLELGRDTS